MPTVLPAATVAKLGRLRLAGRRRVEGRFSGAHMSRRFGSSMDFADYREYVAGDDPRHIDVNAHARLGKRLIKLYDAEDEAALRVVIDRSASMGFGRKLQTALEVAAAFAVVATATGDRVRLLLAGETVDPGPWFRGQWSMAAVDQRLSDLVAEGSADVATAVRRAVGEGPRGPAVLVSDLLFDGWEDALDALALGRADTCLVHLLGRGDLEPDLDGDLRLTDAETGTEVEVGLAADVLAEYGDAARRWLDAVQRGCGSRGIAYTQLVDDQPLEDFLLSVLPAAGVLA